MAIGDALATVWMQRRQITPDEFATNHPGGQLGKRLTLFVRDLMIPIDRILPLLTSAPLVQVVEELTRYGIGTVWVRDAQSNKAIDGIITDGDLRRSLRAHEPANWATLTAGTIMTADPITVDGDALAFEAMKKMERNNKKAISVLPVANLDGKIIGILRLHDLVQAGLGEQPTKDN
jgi:arabinose-5-phosphate isomerase